MDSPSQVLRRSSRIPKPVNFGDYDDSVFENNPLPEEINEEEGNF
jgi:hypothetical protein